MDTTTSPTCKRCKGARFIDAYAHIDGGRCWACADHSDRPAAVYGPPDPGVWFEKTHAGITVAGNGIRAIVRWNGQVRDFASISSARLFATTLLGPR